MILEHKRHLCLCAAAVVTGILIAERPKQIWIFSVILLAAAISYCIFTCKEKKERIAVFFLMTALALTAYIRCECQIVNYESLTAEAPDGERISLTGTICQKESKANSYLYYVRDTVYTIGDKEVKGGKIAVYADTDALPVGSVIWASGDAARFEPAANEGNFDASAYYRQLNVAFQVYAETLEEVRAPLCALRERLYRLQQQISAVFVSELNERDAGILCTLVLGNRAFLGQDVKEAYRDGGISHILAISGLHISILGYSIYRFLRKIHCSYLCAASASSVIVTAFAVMSGFGVSSRRAMLMYLIMMGAQVTGRTYDAGNALAAAALVILLFNPLSLFQSGFLLSFTALLAIVLGSTLREEKEERVGERPGKIRGFFMQLLDSLKMSVRIQLFLIPLTAWLFYEVPIYSLFLNMLVIPLCSWLLGFGIAGGLSGLLFPQLSKWLLIVCHLILDVYEKGLAVTQLLPGSSRITGQPPRWLLCLYFLLLAILYLARTRELYRLKWQGGEREDLCSTRTRKPRCSRGKDVEREGLCFARTRKPRSLRGQDGERRSLFPVRLRQLRCSKALSLGCGVLLSLILIAPGSRQPRTDILHVGQGDGIFISDGAGSSVFVDGGSTDESQVGAYRILPFLKYHGVRGIDAWIITHGDEDHISGFLEVLEDGYPVRALLLAEAMPRDAQWERLVEAAGEADCEVIYVSAGDEIAMSEVRMRCLFPNADDSGEDANALSQVWELRAEDFSMLLCGDIGTQTEEVLLERELVEDVTVLKCAHHGSKYSTGADFLDAARPEWTVISCGENNRYGHPHEDTLARLFEAGSQVSITWQEGQITFLKTRDGWTVRFPCSD